MALWERLFDTLLNVSSCACQPSLGALRAELVQFLAPRSHDLALALSRARALVADSM